MFPYTPEASPDEVIAFMRGLGATTITRVPRTGHTPLPGYETRPWAQPPASIAFYAPAYQEGGPVAKWVRRASLAQPVRTNEHWLQVMNHLFGADLGLKWRISRNDGFTQDIGDKEFIFLDKLGDHLVRAGYKRQVTANTVMLFLHTYRAKKYNPQHPVARVMAAKEALPDPWRALRDVAAVVNCAQLTSAQQRDCIDRDIDITNITGLLAQGIPYPLIRDLYPVSTRTRFFALL